MVDIIMKTKIGKGGRLVIPAEYRKALGLKPGDEVQVALINNGEIRVFSMHQAIKLAQNLVRRYVPKDRSLSEELIRERRENGPYD